MDSSKSIEANAQRNPVPRRVLTSAGKDAADPAVAPLDVAPAPLLAGTAEQNGHPYVCVEFEIDDEKCRVICLDAAGLTGSRARVSPRSNGSAAKKEVARFEVEGLKYALLMPDTPRAERAVRREAEAAARTNFLKLLTQRELQIVRLICAGCLNQQAAERLQISEYTVGSHLKNVYVKLGLRTRGELLFRGTQMLARAAGNGAAND